MKKRTFYTEIAYLVGIVTIALGVAFMEKADFGLSMVVAPAYLLYLKLSQTLSFVTFGMMEYVFQAVLLGVMMLVLRRGRVSWLFSFVTAVVYGFVLDGCMALVAPFAATTFFIRCGSYALGMLLCAIGVSSMFHTYLAPEVYELFVKEVAAKTGKNINRVKTVYDLTSCAVGVVLSFIFFGFGHFEGVKLGTVVCALVNGYVIGLVSRAYDSYFTFRDALPLRKYFETPAAK